MKGLVLGLAACLLVTGAVMGQQDVEKKTEIVWEATIVGVSG